MTVRLARDPDLFSVHDCESRTGAKQKQNLTPSCLGLNKQNDKMTSFEPCLRAYSASTSMWGPGENGCDIHRLEGTGLDRDCRV